MIDVVFLIIPFEIAGFLLRARDYTELALIPLEELASI
jgi:hypothetical protein